MNVNRHISPIAYGRGPIWFNMRDRVASVGDREMWSTLEYGLDVTNILKIRIKRLQTRLLRN
jgi:hypothetical protein